MTQADLAVVPEHGPVVPGEIRSEHVQTPNLVTIRELVLEGRDQDLLVVVAGDVAVCLERQHTLGRTPESERYISLSLFGGLPVEPRRVLLIARPRGRRH